jgi:hypothetical protein
MSKSKANRGVASPRAQNKRQPQSDANLDAKIGRRKFLTLGLGGAGALGVAGIAAYGYSAGWFNSAPAAPSIAAAWDANLATNKPLPPITLPADHQGALRAAEDIVRHYTRELNNPSTMIHAVRAFGKNFTLNDGSKAVDVLCARFAADREVNGKRYVYFPREHEVHDNSFLKTMLEAGVGPDQPITVGESKYTLRDLGESAKALFRCDPQNLARYDPKMVHQHLPWGLIAFSILVPPSQSTWTNAYGETINLPETINSSLSVFEATCAGVGEAISHGEDETSGFRQEIGKYACEGMHMLYGFFSCLNHGYTNNKLEERLSKQLDTVLQRLKGDTMAIDREAADAARVTTPEQISRMVLQQEGGGMTSKGAPPPNLIEVRRLLLHNKVLGHAMEAINYASLHKLFKLTPDQQKRSQAGEQALYENLVKMRAIDLDAYKRWYPKYVNNIVIAIGHATRALKLLTPDNPDTMAG